MRNSVDISSHDGLKTVACRKLVQGVTHVAYTILVVEDTADSRELMRLILEAEGYRVLEAGNGFDAVETAQRESPNAILMDMSLPLMDGCQATRRIRQSPNLRAIPIIACTAHNRWDWRAKAIVAGCTDFLTKPLESKVLLAMLSRYLN
jgi:two-component system cell cycle response regulator DivK